MKLLDPITRDFLIKVIQASNFAHEIESRGFIESLVMAGRFAPATQDEIEYADYLDNTYGN